MKQLALQKRGHIAGGNQTSKTEPHMAGQCEVVVAILYGQDIDLVDYAMATRRRKEDASESSGAAHDYKSPSSQQHQFDWDAVAQTVIPILNSRLVHSWCSPFTSCALRKRRCVNDGQPHRPS